LGVESSPLDEHDKKIVNNIEYKLLIIYNRL